MHGVGTEESRSFLLLATFSSQGGKPVGFRGCTRVSPAPLPPPYSWPPLQSPNPSNSWEILLNSPQGSTQGSIFSLELQNTCFFSHHVVSLHTTKYHTVFWTIRQSFCLYLSHGYFHADPWTRARHLTCLVLFLSSPL